MSLSSSSLNSSSLFLSSFELLDLLLDEEFELLDFELEFDLCVDFGAVVDFDDDVIFDEKDGDVEVEVKVINEKADGKEEEKPEKEESDDDTEETETINLEEV